MSTTPLTQTPGPAPYSNLFAQFNLLREFDRDTFGVLERGFRDYGDVWKVTIGSMVQFMFAHPEHLHQILVTDADKFNKDPNYKDVHKGMARFMGNGLVTSDGDFWRRQRKLIQPSFHTKRVETYAEVMIDQTHQETATWRDGEQLDVDHRMMELTLKIVVEALFKTDISEDTDRIGEAMTAFQETSNNQSQLIPTWVPTPGELRTRRSIRDVNDIMYRLISERRQRPQDRGDLLTMLLEARDDEGKGMTDEQIRDELVTLFMAGHETTANTLNWTFVLLAQNPHVQARLLEEIDTVLAGRAPTLADLRSLPYLDGVLKESQRLYPVVFAMGRQAMTDVVIGGHLVPKGSILGLFPYVTHRDPRWWGEDALMFRPERFAPELEKQQVKYSYIPFSAGPRVCIGNSFAIMEMRLLLAAILQRWTLELEGPAPEREALITMRPKGGLKMRARARQRIAAMQPAETTLA